MMSTTKNMMMELTVEQAEKGIQALLPVVHARIALGKALRSEHPEVPVEVEEERVKWARWNVPARYFHFFGAYEASVEAACAPEASSILRAANSLRQKVADLFSPTYANYCAMNLALDDGDIVKADMLAREVVASAAIAHTLANRAHDLVTLADETLSAQEAHMVLWLAYDASRRYTGVAQWVQASRRAWARRGLKLAL